MASQGSFSDSIMLMDEQDREFGLNLAQHLRFNFYNNREQFFYDMVTALRYINEGNDTVAYTTPDKYIFMNAPKGASIGKKIENWKFIFIHECLHQVWDTFGVEEQVKKDKGSCDHTLMNVASDCIINDYINSRLGLDYPTDGLITPEYIKQQFGIDYDRREDDQYSLYMKLAPQADKIKKDNRVKKMMDENAPILDIPGGSSAQVNNNVIETSQAYKDGHEKAIYIINRILKKMYEKYNAQDGDFGKVKDALQDAIKEINNLKGKSKKYIKEALEAAMSLFEYIQNNLVLEAAGPMYRTYDQGFEAGIKEALDNIQNVLMAIAAAESGKTVDKDQDQDIPQTMENTIPDFNDTEEELYLPKTLSSSSQSQNKDDKDKKDDKKSKGNGEGDSKDKKDKKDADGEGQGKGSDSKGKNGKANMPSGDPSKNGKQRKNVGKPQGKGSKGQGHGSTPEGLEEFQDDLDEDEKTPASIVNQYVKSATGSLKDFVSKCRAAKNKGMGAVSRAIFGRDRAKWSQLFTRTAANIMRSKVAQIEKEYRKTYSRPNRRNGVVQPGQVLRKGKVEVKKGVTISMLFFIDISGSMPDAAIRNCFKSVWSICDNIISRYSSNQRIDKIEPLVFAFDDNIKGPYKHNEVKGSDHGGTCDFDKLLNKMKQYNETTALNVILTDAEWSIFESDVLRELRETNGSTIVITNADEKSPSVKAFERIEKASNKFTMILADQSFELK